MEITKEEWQEFQSRINHIESSVHRIERAIAGDEKMGVQGIAYKVQSHEKRFIDNDYKFQKIDEIKNKGYGFMAAFGIFCGLLGTGLWEGIKHLIGK